MMSKYYILGKISGI